MADRVTRTVFRIRRGIFYLHGNGTAWGPEATGNPYAVRSAVERVIERLALTNVEIVESLRQPWDQPIR